MEEITTPRWANMHGHLRQIGVKGDLMEDILPYAHHHYWYYTAMPNTDPPISTGPEALDYKNMIMSLVPKDRRDIFHPITPIKMLWNKGFKTTPRVLEEAQAFGVNCVKLYFTGTTTNSDDGVLVEDFEKLYPTFEMMEKLGMILLIHGEIPGDDINVDEREYVFASDYLPRLDRNFPKLKVVMEHITDRRSVEIIEQLPNNFAATITTHHLYMTKNSVLEPGPIVRNACKPYAKRIEDLMWIQRAALSGNPKFFFGDDNAWHRKTNKFTECASCGCAHTHSVEFVTQFFAEKKKLHLLENFACHFGPAFYGLPAPQGTITVQKTEPYKIPGEIKDVLIWGYERELNWKVVESN